MKLIGITAPTSKEVVEAKRAPLTPSLTRNTRRVERSARIDTESIGEIKRSQKKSIVSSEEPPQQPRKQSMRICEYSPT
jgi:hypothetical protein